MNNVLVIDDSLTEQECDFLIAEGISLPLESKLGQPWDYEHRFMDQCSEGANVILRTLVKTSLEKYVKKYPQVNMTPDKWVVDPFMFKHFPAGHAFSGWHSEHDVGHPFRILSFLVYLSDHNCGTEFFDGDVVMSKMGRVVIFPAFWTHTHRGQMCPDGKDRYILSAYAHIVPS